MESLLDEIAERGLVDKRYHRLLDAVKPDGPGQSPRLTLPELLAAKNEGRLGGLIEQIQDPPLDQAIAEACSWQLADFSSIISERPSVT